MSHPSFGFCAMKPSIAILTIVVVILRSLLTVRMLAFSTSFSSGTGRRASSPNRTSNNSFSNRASTALVLRANRRMRQRHLRVARPRPRPSLFRFRLSTRRRPATRSSLVRDAASQSLVTYSPKTSTGRARARPEADREKPSSPPPRTLPPIASGTRCSLKASSSRSPRRRSRPAPTRRILRSWKSRATLVSRWTWRRRRPPLSQTTVQQSSQASSSCRPLCPLRCVNCIRGA